MKLFTLHHAGGSSIAYRCWKSFLAPEIELVPVELPGHMCRIHEALLENINDAVEDIKNSITSKLEKGEQYSIFGHSMGALMAYLVYNRLIEEKLNAPCHIFLSSHWPPFIENEKGFYDVDDYDECLDRLIENGGVTEELLHNPELLKFSMKIILADFTLLQSVKMREIKLVDSDITVMYGDQEQDFEEEDICKWELAAGRNIKFHKLQGTHMYLFEQPEETVRIINDTLRKYI